MTKAFLILLTFILSACQQKFDKQKWAQVDDLMTFPNRKYMLEDLFNNYNLKGRKYSEIINLLDQPQDGLDSLGRIVYNIDIDYGVEDPAYSKTLVLQFSKDSVVNAYQVDEWHK